MDWPATDPQHTVAALFISVTICILQWKIRSGRKLPESRSAKAERVARKLLLSHLNPGQMAEFITDGEFTVLGSRTKRKYTVSKSGVTCAGYSYCLVTYGLFDVPSSDVVLTRKILIESDEDLFLDVANPFPR